MPRRRTALRIGIWPTRPERRRLLRLWLHRRRQPARATALPRAWRRQVRLAFWWTVLCMACEEPGWLLLGGLAWPAWLAWLAWRCLRH